MIVAPCERFPSVKHTSHIHWDQQFCSIGRCLYKGTGPVVKKIKKDSGKKLKNEGIESNYYCR